MVVKETEVPGASPFLQRCFRFIPLPPPSKNRVHRRLWLDPPRRVLRAVPPGHHLQRGLQGRLRQLRRVGVERPLQLRVR